MNSRDRILRAISQNKPAPGALPELPSFKTDSMDLPVRFAQTLAGIGGTCLTVSDFSQIELHLKTRFSPEQETVNLVPGINWPGIAWQQVAQPHELATIHLAILEGALGVAENAAVWVDERHLSIRVIPFICQHLVIVLRKQNLVGNLHEAYAQLPVKEAGYGVFIAGPSKTADIEQSLVIGAHGSRSLTVFLLED